MTHYIKQTCRILNYISYLLISLSLLALIQFSYYPKYILDFFWLQNEQQLIVLYHKDYHNLVPQEDIYYYKNGTITQSKVDEINIAKYRIHLQNGVYTTPSQYIGTPLLAFTLPVSLTQINTYLQVGIFFSFLLLTTLLYPTLKQIHPKLHPHE